MLLWKNQQVQKGRQGQQEGQMTILMSPLFDVSMSCSEQQGKQRQRDCHAAAEKPATLAEKTAPTGRQHVNDTLLVRTV